MSAAAEPASAFAAYGVRKVFGKRVVLDGLTLNVPRGCVLGLLGENGSGKSTLLKILLGLLPADGGATSIVGEPSRELSPELRTRIGYVAQSPEQFSWLTGKAMLRYVGSFYPTFDWSYARDLAARWRISLQSPIAALSPGQQQRLSIIRALSSRPELLVLDEPIASIDPATRMAIIEELVAITQERAATVIFSSHITGDLERLCTHYAVISAGKVAVLEPANVMRTLVRVTVRGEESQMLGDDFGPALHVRKSREGERVVVIEREHAREMTERLPPAFGTTIETVNVEAVLSEWMR